MNRFEYYEPATLHDAVRLLVRCGPRRACSPAAPICSSRSRRSSARPDISSISSAFPASTRSSTIRSTDCASARSSPRARSRLHPAVLRHYPGLAQAARELGSIQVRNRATIAGNVCRASPSADTLPPLIADGAQVILVGPAAQDGAYAERTVALEEFFTGPGQTVLRPDEIVTRDHRCRTRAAHRQALHQARATQGDGARHRRRGRDPHARSRAMQRCAYRARRRRADADPGAAAPKPCSTGARPTPRRLAAVARAAMAEATPDQQHPRQRRLPARDGRGTDAARD